MLDNYLFFTDKKKRIKNFSRLNNEEVDVLRSSDNPEYLSKEFDRIFLKLQRLISYSLKKNQDKLNHLDEESHNVLTKLLNKVKWKILERKSTEIQRVFFNDIAHFLNFFDWDSYFTKVHNSVSKTSLNDFSHKSVWNEFFDLTYWRLWNFDSMCEGWSCKNWTVLYYNFFNKLKKAWLNIDIKLFRYKNIQDRIGKIPTARHSWLIITFDWEEYFVDQDWIIFDDEKSIVRKLQPFIDNEKKKGNDNPLVSFFENFKHENMKETDMVIFFDSLDDFIKHTVDYPGIPRLAFYLPDSNENVVNNITVEFISNGIWIAVNGQWQIYYLRNNNLNRDTLHSDIIKRIEYFKDDSWVHQITKESKDFFIKIFNIVFDRIDRDWLYNNFQNNWKRASEIVDFWWKTDVFMMKKV